MSEAMKARAASAVIPSACTMARTRRSRSKGSKTPPRSKRTISAAAIGLGHLRIDTEPVEPPMRKGFIEVGRCIGDQVDADAAGAGQGVTQHGKGRALA